MIPIFNILLAATLWGVIGPVSKFAFARGIDPIEVAFWRGLMGGTLFAIEAIVRKEKKPAGKDFRNILLFGFFAVAGLEASNLLAVNAGGAGFASIMLYGAPVWIALYDFIVLKQPVRAAKTFAIGLALAGIVGMTQGGSASAVGFSSSAVFWGLISGISYALFYIAGRAWFARLSPALVYGIAFPFASLCILPFVHFAHKDSQVWGVLIFNGVISTYFAYFFYARGLKCLDPVRASVIAAFEPVVSMAFAAAIWGERWSIVGYSSAILVLAGVTLAAFSGRELE